jgi:hypothetical protein
LQRQQTKQPKNVAGQVSATATKTTAFKITTKKPVMKKVSFYLFALFATLLFATSCEKNQPEPPKTTIPDAYAGKWMLGNFDMGSFWNYNGTRQPDATNMVAYDIKKDGSAEQFIYYIYDDGSDKQAMNYRKGTMTFDAATNTLKFCPAEGRYRIFENGNKDEDAISASGLFPKYAPQYRNCTFDEDNQVQYLVGTNDQNERIGFAKVSW